MRVEYLSDGTPQPIFEVGDFVRLVRDEDGPFVTARAGDWGQVERVNGNRVDVRLAGFCRPRTTDFPVVRDLPRYCLQPSDRRGMAIPLRQRDVAEKDISRPWASRR